MLKKDLLELCLLYLLSEGDRYGYEMLSRLHDVFPDTRESVIYAQLRGLCQQGYTEFYQGDTSAGPARKYYRLTESGGERCEALLNQWRALCSAMAALGVE